MFHWQTIDRCLSIFFFFLSRNRVENHHIRQLCTRMNCQNIHRFSVLFKRNGITWYWNSHRSVLLFDAPTVRIRLYVTQTDGFETRVNNYYNWSVHYVLQYNRCNYKTLRPNVMPTKKPVPVENDSSDNVQLDSFDCSLRFGFILYRRRLKIYFGVCTFKKRIRIDLVRVKSPSSELDLVKSGLIKNIPNKIILKYNKKKNFTRCKRLVFIKIPSSRNTGAHTNEFTKMYVIYFHLLCTPQCNTAVVVKKIQFLFIKYTDGWYITTINRYSSLSRADGLAIFTVSVYIRSCLRRKATLNLFTW